MSLAIDSYDIVNLEISPSKCTLEHAVGEVIGLIRHRINLIFGQVSHEILVVCHSCTRERLPDEYFKVKIAGDDNIPLDTVFVLCKSVDGREIIHPLEPISWTDYFCKVMLYNMGKASDMPGLVVDQPHLQARIKINEK